MRLVALAVAGLVAVTVPGFAQTQTVIQNAPNAAQVGVDGQPPGDLSDALAQVPPDQVPPPPPAYTGLVIGGLVIGGIVTAVVVSSNNKSTPAAAATSASP